MECSYNVGISDFMGGSTNAVSIRVRHDTQRPGYLFTLLAVTIFATQDGISKYLGTHYSPILITMIRYWVFAAFVLLLAIRSGGIAKAAATKRPFCRFFAASCLLLKSLHSYSPSVARAWQQHNRSFRARRYW